MLYTGISANSFSEEVDVCIAGNRVSGPAVGVGLFDISSVDGSVEDNIVRPVERHIEGADGNWAVGIFSQDVAAATIARNFVSCSPVLLAGYGCNGILAADSSADITGNRVSGTSHTGIAFLGTDEWNGEGLQVENNVVVVGWGTGIFGELHGLVVDTMITNNVVAFTEPCGGGDMAYGDGISLISSSLAEPIMVRENVLVGNARAGVFVSNAQARVELNDIHGNGVSLAWQDGAEITVGQHGLLQ